VDEAVEAPDGAPLEETAPFLLRQGGQVVLEGLSIVPRATLADEQGPFADLLIGDGPSGGSQVEALTVRAGDEIQLDQGDLVVESVRASERGAPGGLVLAYRLRGADPD